VASLHKVGAQWQPIFEGIAQGLPSAPTLFNIFVDVALVQIHQSVDRMFAYADENTAVWTQRPTETRSAFFDRVETNIKKITQVYHSIDAELSPSKSVLLGFQMLSTPSEIAGRDQSQTHE